MNIKTALISGFPAFTHKPYRWFWWGQNLSQIGAWAQNVSLVWLVLLLTGSPFLLGVVSALQRVPVMLFSLYAGVLIDRFPRRRILLFTQSTMMAFSLSMALLISLGLVEYWMILVFAISIGMVNCIDIPARQSLIVELVGKEHLTNAIALNSASFNSARLVGPAIAGVILGFWGAAWCFFINGLSFIGVIVILYRLPKLPGYDNRQKKGPLRENNLILPEMIEGLKYIKQNHKVMLSILMVGIFSTIGMNFNILVSSMAKYELGKEALGYGLLLSSLGIGAIIGAILVAIQSKKEPSVYVMVGGMLAFAMFSIVLGSLSGYLAAALVLGLMGCSMICFSATANSLIQMNSTDSFRGRVMSVHSLMNHGLAPFGNLYAGILAELWGAQKTFMLNGLILLTFICILAFNKKSFLRSSLQNSHSGF